MKLNKRFDKFMKFLFNRKLPNMFKNRTTGELIDLYNEYAPRYFSLDSSMEEHIKGAIVIYLIGQEMKLRFGDKIPDIYHWNYNNPIDFNSYFVIKRNNDKKRFK